MIEAPDKAICAMSQEAKDQFNEDVMGFRARGRTAQLGGRCGSY